MLSCKEVAANADQLVDGSLSLRRRLSMRLHILICGHCRRYLKQLKSLLQAIPFMHGTATDVEVEKVMEIIHNEADVEQ